MIEVFQEPKEMNKMCGITGQDLIDFWNEELEAEGKNIPPIQEVIDKITSWRFE